MNASQLLHQSQKGLSITKHQNVRKLLMTQLCPTIFSFYYAFAAMQKARYGLCKFVCFSPFPPHDNTQIGVTNIMNILFDISILHHSTFTNLLLVTFYIKQELTCLCPCSVWQGTVWPHQSMVEQHQQLEH